MSGQNKALARRWFEEVWNQGSESAIDELFHPQGKAHGGGWDVTQMPHGYRSFTMPASFNARFSASSAAICRSITRCIVASARAV